MLVQNEPVVNLNDVSINNQFVEFFFDCTEYNVWLENANKHVPEIYELLLVDNKYCLDLRTLPEELEITHLKLSLGCELSRVEFKSRINSTRILRNENFELFIISIDSGFSILINRCITADWTKKLDALALKNSARFDVVLGHNRQLNLAVFGSCFSRSIFRSEDFFNPGYKDIFTIISTVFHSSIISLMSTSMHSSYTSLPEDLLEQNVYQYIKYELTENIKYSLSLGNIDYIVIDNYPDATLEVFDMGGDFITFNRYFSESAFKRNFAGKKLLRPGTPEHIARYRFAVKCFLKLLKDLGLDRKIILIGGRLSYFKSKNSFWVHKSDWIRATNHNWNIYDTIFLEEFPYAHYIDMRSTNWICDEGTPLLGGASPSHYQSEFYKDIYAKITRAVHGQVL